MAFGSRHDLIELGLAPPGWDMSRSQPTRIKTTVVQPDPGPSPEPEKIPNYAERMDAHNEWLAMQAKMAANPPHKTLPDFWWLPEEERGKRRQWEEEDFDERRLEYIDRLVSASQLAFDDLYGPKVSQATRERVKNQEWASEKARLYQKELEEKARGTTEVFGNYVQDRLSHGGVASRRGDETAMECYIRNLIEAMVHVPQIRDSFPDYWSQQCLDLAKIGPKLPQRPDSLIAFDMSPVPRTDPVTRAREQRCAEKIAEVENRAAMHKSFVILAAMIIIVLLLASG